MLIERVNISIDIGFTIYKLGSGNPCISLVSGLTLSDGCGIIALRNIVKKLKGETIHGTIIIIPQLVEHVHILRINRSKSISTITYRLIKELTEHIPSQCPTIILRCKNNFIPHIVIPSKCREDEIGSLVNAIPIEYVVKSKMPTKIIKQRKCKILTLVMRGGKDFELEDVDYVSQSITDMFSNLGFLGKKTKVVQHKYFNGYHVIRCLSRGIFRPAIENGTNVSSGIVIGDIDDNEMRSPVDGTILYISRPRLCDIGDIVCIIAMRTNSET